MMSVRGVPADEGVSGPLARTYSAKGVIVPTDPFEDACSAMAAVLMDAVGERLYYELEQQAKPVIGEWPDDADEENDYSRRFDVMCAAALIEAGMEMLKAVGLGVVTKGGNDE